MAWNGTRTWTSGEVVSAANLNTYISQNLDALATPPFCDVYATAPGSTSGTANTQTAISFDSEIADTATMHNPVSNPTRVTVPIDGLYHVEAGAIVQSAATNFYFRGFITLNGSAPTSLYPCAWVPVGATYVSLTESRYIRATANQYFEFFVLASNASVPIVNNNNLRPFMQVRWMGP